MYTLIVINDQGASEETRNLETPQDVRRAINEWEDPENMTARVFDSEAGNCVYDGPADRFFDVDKAARTALGDPETVRAAQKHLDRQSENWPDYEPNHE